MKIDFDPEKDAANLEKHGVSLADARRLDWDEMIWWPDTRRNYGEDRCVGVAPIGNRLFVVVYVDRNPARRIISLRKANEREVRLYAQSA